MAVDSPIWPARLDHLRLDSDEPAALASFYAGCLGLVETPLADGTQRRLSGGRTEHIAIVAARNPGPLSVPQRPLLFI